MSQRCVFIAVCILAAALLFPMAVQACAVCLTSGGQNDPVADAFKWSVLFLMAMPYTVAGSIAVWLFYNHRRAAGRRGGAGKKAPILNLAWTHKESGR